MIRNYFEITSECGIRIDSEVPINEVNQSDGAVVYIVNNNVDYLDFTYYNFLSIHRDIINAVRSLHMCVLSALPENTTLCYLYNVCKCINNKSVCESTALKYIKEEYNKYITITSNKSLFSNFELLGGGMLKTFLYQRLDGSIYLESGEVFDYEKHDPVLFLRNYRNIINTKIDKNGIKKIELISNTIGASINYENF